MLQIWVTFKTWQRLATQLTGQTQLLEMEGHQNQSKSKFGESEKFSPIFAQVDNVPVPIPTFSGSLQEAMTFTEMSV